MNWQEEFIYWLKYNEYWQQYIGCLDVLGILVTDENDVIDYLDDKYTTSFVSCCLFADYSFWYEIHLEWRDYVEYWGKNEN